jgi:hypothetical protein
MADIEQMADDVSEHADRLAQDLSLDDAIEFFEALDSLIQGTLGGLADDLRRREANE